MNNLIILLSIVTQIYGSIHISNINYSLASELLFETVDKTIRPCENFYQFTCNKWIRNEILKPGVDRVFRNTRAHFEFYDEFFYKILHGKKEAETEATKIIKFIVRRCTTEYYIQNIENINIDAAYQQCLDKYELFASYAFHTTILNCIFGYEKILQLNSTIHEMFEMLKNEFKLLVREKDWVDLESRRRINEKIKDMDLEVTYDGNLYNIMEMEKTYALFNFQLNATHKEIENSVKKFIKNQSKINPLLFTGYRSPIAVNAEYIEHLNKVYAYFGLLKKPVFDLMLPTALKFGIYGSVLGHEIIHGFSEIALKVLKKNVAGYLFTDYTKNWFNGRKACVIKYYNSMKHSTSGLFVDGEKTIGENLSDNGGIKIAYRAYKKFVHEHGDDKNKIPGFEEYTNDQIFFIGFGQYYCDKYTEAGSKFTIKNKVHAPGEIRVLGTVVNQRIFSDTFNCPVGSNMNLPKKCNVWRKKNL